MKKFMRDLANISIPKNDNKKMIKEFEEACKPMEEFINKWGCPHDTIIIEQSGAQFKTGRIGIPFKIRD